LNEIIDPNESTITGVSVIGWNVETLVVTIPDTVKLSNLNEISSTKWPNSLEL